MFWKPHEAVPEQLQSLISGGFAGMVAKSVVAPLDRIKIIFQVSSTPFTFRKIPLLISRIIQDEGTSALWKGNTATLVRVFPYAGVQFMVYDSLKKYFTVKRESQGKVGVGPFNSMLAGSTAGGLSSIVTYPLDLTRARLAVLHNSPSNPPAKKVNFISITMSNYRSNGITGLYRGIPYAGIAFTLNESIRASITTTYKREPTTFEKLQAGGIAGLIAQSLTYPLDVTRRRMQTVGLVSASGEFHSASARLVTDF